VLSYEQLGEFRVDDGKGFRLAEHPTSWLPEAARDLPKAEAKARSERILEDAREDLDELQQRLYAENHNALLLVFQAMDAGGKDGTIRHVMSGVNPQGCQVYSFKAPSAEEQDHDYLWRCQRALPERGRIGIFNRSHYEEVLVVRVHPELLGAEHLRGAKPTKSFWQRRYRQINDWERHLEENGTRVVKFFLNVSKDEQRKRFLERLEDPSKNWKWADGDLAERAHWDEYQEAYEDAIAGTATRHAPWYVIPADRKHVMRSLVSTIVVSELKRLDPKYPEVTGEQRERIATARAALGEQH
jgi:PPK2 family polyphosphate:nucleotide phosphotransferase